MKKGVRTEMGERFKMDINTLMYLKSNNSNHSWRHLIQASVGVTMSLKHTPCSVTFAGDLAADGVG